MPSYFFFLGAAFFLAGAFFFFPSSLATNPMAASLFADSFGPLGAVSNGFSSSPSPSPP